MDRSRARRDLFPDEPAGARRARRDSGRSRGAHSRRVRTRRRGEVCECHDSGSTPSLRPPRMARAARDLRGRARRRAGAEGGRLASRRSLRSELRSPREREAVADRPAGNRPTHDSHVRPSAGGRAARLLHGTGRIGVLRAADPAPAGLVLVGRGRDRVGGMGAPRDGHVRRVRTRRVSRLATPPRDHAFACGRRDMLAPTLRSVGRPAVRGLRGDAVLVGRRVRLQGNRRVDLGVRRQSLPSRRADRGAGRSAESHLPVPDRSRVRMGRGVLPGHSPGERDGDECGRLSRLRDRSRVLRTSVGARVRSFLRLPARDGPRRLRGDGGRVSSPRRRRRVAVRPSAPRIRARLA